MKRGLMYLNVIILAMCMVFVSCGDDEPEDTCSNEMGDVGDDYGCSAPVMPQICSVDGVDDHYVLDGVEYACDNPGCPEGFPQDMVDAILALEGCGSKKSLDLEAINLRISKESQVILANLKMEQTLCKN